MEEAKTSFKEIFSHYRLEAIFLGLAVIVCVISGAIFLATTAESTEDTIEIDKSTQIKPGKDTPTQSTIYIDVSGAVEKPNLYKLTSGDRLKDAIDKAGGLSTKADKNYFARTFNLSRLLLDQEKIYIPTSSEVTAGLINSEITETGNTTSASNQSDANKVLINSASLDELDGLIGIGKTIGEKIIDNRPYTSIDELLEKKIVGQKVFDGIKDLIAL